MRLICFHAPLKLIIRRRKQSKNASKDFTVTRGKDFTVTRVYSKLSKLLITKLTFSFQRLTVYTVKEVKAWSTNKATAREIPIKIQKESGFTFAYVTCCINEAIWSGKLQDFLKLSNLVPVTRRKLWLTKRTIDQLVSWFFTQRYLRKKMFGKLYI